MYLLSLDLRQRNATKDKVSVLAKSREPSDNSHQKQRTGLRPNPSP